MGIKLKRKKRGGSSSADRTQQRSDSTTWNNDARSGERRGGKKKGQKEPQFQSPSERGYPGTAEYIDTRGTFSKGMSRSAENISGTATSGRTTAKYGDPNFPEIAYLSGDKSFKGGTWDRSGSVFTPGKKSYTPTRTPAGRGYTYSMDEIREV